MWGDWLGREDFEPPNGGIKIRCLTTWRRPNLLRSYVGLYRLVKPPTPTPPLRPVRLLRAAAVAAAALRTSRSRLHLSRSSAPAARRAGFPARPAPRRSPAASPMAGACRSLLVRARSRAMAAASSHASGNSAGAENAPCLARNTAGVGTATPGFTSTMPKGGSRGAGPQNLADPAHTRRRRIQANRHIRAQRQARSHAAARPSPKTGQQAQRRRRIGRAAADARRHRQVLLQAAAPPPHLGATPAPRGAEDYPASACNTAPNRPDMFKHQLVRRLRAAPHPPRRETPRGCPAR